MMIVGLFCKNPLLPAGTGEIMIKLNNDSNQLMPYEKCMKYGPDSLTDSELIAVILRTGTKNNNCIQIAENVLSSFDKLGLMGFLQFGIDFYKNIDGIGDVRAIMLSCIGELATRISNSTKKDMIEFTNSDMVADYYMHKMKFLDKEHFICLMLDLKCHLLHERVLSIGTVDKTCISPREIFREALSYGAVNLIILHNHPSGDPTPSTEDINVTRVIRQAGAIIGIRLIDHLIIGDNCYVSFMDKNLL